jgi:voltage-gated potassium channel
MMDAVVAPAGTLRTRNEADEKRLDDFERRMTFPILASALLPIIFSLAGRDSIVGDAVQIVAWIVFIVDYVVHQRLIPKYARSAIGIFDFFVVVLTAPWFLIPGLGNSRFLALARLARLARVLKAGGRRLRHLANQLGRVGVVTGALIFTCGYVAFSAEKSVNPEFASFGDAIWWATVTITTVGYGDITPITTIGRIAAVVLMFSGVGLLGVLAGTLASFFGLGDGSPATPAVPSPSADTAASSVPDLADLAALRAQVAALDSAIAALQDRAP